MIDWIFEGIANWVASIMTQVMDAVSGVFLEALGTDMTAMEEYFPFVTAAYSIMQYTAWALLFLIVVWQLFRTFGGPITEAEPPFELLARGALFAFLITYAKPIFSLVLEIARAPYTALMESSLDPGDFTFAGIEQALTSGLTTIVSVATVVGLILLIVMMIALGWNYFKLLLETVERYVLVGVLCYTSPLAYAMGASKSTSRVFQSWCRMVGSQLLLLVLNVWFLRAFNSSVGHFVANGGALTSGQGNIFLWIFCALALLKIAQRADSYLAAMGLSVAQTGSSMGMEMLMAARCMTAALGELKPLMTGGNAKTVGRACIGTVRGDMHDIGKNLVKIMLEGSGVEVIDLGVDVTPEQFVETAKRQRCGVIACSSLLTTTMGEMRRVVTLAREAGIRDQVKIFVGGAPISQSFCDEIGADVYTEDAAAAARAAVSALKG